MVKNTEFIIFGPFLTKWNIFLSKTGQLNITIKIKHNWISQIYIWISLDINFNLNFQTILALWTKFAHKKWKFKKM